MAGDDGADDPNPLVGQCIWYNECGEDDTTGKPLNCLYNKPAPPMTDPAGQKLLATLCPQFTNITEGNPTLFYDFPCFKVLVTPSESDML